MIIVIFTMGTLTIFGLVGLSHVDTANFTPLVPHGAGSILQAAAILFFAYTRYARIATLGDEITNPSY